VTFSWRDSRQARQGGFGLTRDVSIRSAFVLTPCPPPLRANLALRAFFPPVVGIAAPVGIQGEGRVVRVEATHHSKGSGGFAVVGKRFVLRRGEE
jgi:hypothetical protein